VLGLTIDAMNPEREIAGIDKRQCETREDQRRTSIWRLSEESTEIRVCVKLQAAMVGAAGLC
jgi:hypothetical protein